MRSKRSINKGLIFFISVLCLSLTIGYAYLSQSLRINNTASIAKTTWDIHFENAIINKESTKEFTPEINEDKTVVSTTLEFKKPGDFYEYTVDIVNKGTIDAMVSLVNITNLTTEQQKYLEYKISYEDDTEISTYDALFSGEKETIKVRVSFKKDVEESDLPNEATTITLEAAISYAQANENANERNKSFKLYDVLRKNAIEDTDINYGAISSDINGKGIYKLTKIETSTPIYYYRGEVDNNVIFGGFCWKMIRTTETGGVKLIYNGEPTEGTCDNTGNTTEIGKSSFYSSNYSQTDEKYIGYMYDNNTVNSVVKTVIDAWFANNLLSYQDYLEDTPFYNERDYVKGAGYPRLYASAQRIWGINWNYDIENATIKLGAANKEDIFTVSSEIGNGALTYPIGLITSDEVVMAGGRASISISDIGENTTYYLYSGNDYLTLSPRHFSADSYANMVGVYRDGHIFWGLVINKVGVRPVVSLKSGTEYLSGDGTAESPFVILNTGHF